MAQPDDATPDPRPPSEDDPRPETWMADVYEELRRLAASYMRQERANHTLQPTAIVNEAYLRLARLDRIEWRDKTHFFVAAAGAIRRVLVDSARAHKAAKRGGGASRRVTLSGVSLHDERVQAQIDLLALDDALVRLAEKDPRKARVVELRFFSGLTIAETARALDVGTTTVEDDWAFARSWLRREIGSGTS